MTETALTDSDDNTLLITTTRIVAAYARKASLTPTQLSETIAAVGKALTELNSPQREALPQPRVPAVPIKRSVYSDFVVCLEDGKRFKMLKRHLQTDHGLSPQQYRAKWSLPDEYPMVAPTYAAVRSAFAKQVGLGARKREPDPKLNTQLSDQTPPD